MNFNIIYYLFAILGDLNEYFHFHNYLRFQTIFFLLDSSHIECAISSKNCGAKLYNSLMIKLIISRILMTFHFDLMQVKLKANSCPLEMVYFEAVYFSVWNLCWGFEISEIDFARVVFVKILGNCFVDLK